MSTVDPDLDFIRVDEQAFLACPEESVDYAVMERTADAVVMPMNAGWSDVGSWSSLWEISAHTAEGNVHHGDVISHKTEKQLRVCRIWPGDDRRGEGSGGGADQRCGADRRSQRGAGRQKVVEQIKADGRHEHHIHREVYRPWGKYDSIDAGDRYR